jgi:hypothetical protein
MSVCPSYVFFVACLSVCVLRMCPRYGLLCNFIRLVDYMVVQNVVHLAVGWHVHFVETLATIRDRSGLLEVGVSFTDDGATEFHPDLPRVLAAMSKLTGDTKLMLDSIPRIVYTAPFKVGQGGGGGWRRGGRGEGRETGDELGTAGGEVECVFCARLCPCAFVDVLSVDVCVRLRGVVCVSPAARVCAVPCVCVRVGVLDVCVCCVGRFGSFAAV